MADIQIINMKKGGEPRTSYDFRIDRESPVGNPFKITRTRNRDAVCDMYEDFFQERMLDGGGPFCEYIDEMEVALRKHGRIRLFCWCPPLRCHGETIIDELERRIDT